MSARWLVAPLTLLLLGACGEERSAESRRPASAAGSAPVARLDVLFAGCAEVRRGPTCELAAGQELTLWASSDAPIEYLAGDAKLSPTRTQVDGGERVLLKLPAGATLVTARARRSAVDPVASWTVRVTPHTAPGWSVEAQRLRAAGQLEAAASALERALTEAPPGQAAHARSALARLRLAQGAVADALPLLRSGVRAHRTAGALRSALWDGLALAHVTLASLGDPTTASEVLNQLVDLAAQVPEGAVNADYTRSFVARDVGDLRQALRLLAKTARWAHRLGMGARRQAAVGARAHLLQRLGRHAEAERELAELVAGLSPQALRLDVARARNDLGWARLLARAAGASSDPEPDLRVAMAGFRGAGTPDELANVHVNLALAALLREPPAPQDALTELAALRRVSPEPEARLRPWIAEVEARAALLSGQADQALAAYRALERRAKMVVDPAARWRAAVGLADALATLGRREEAVGAYGDAERALDAQLPFVPLGAGRDTFLGDRGKSARALVGLLVALDRPDEALAAVRSARRRVLGSLRGLRLEGLSSPSRARWAAALEAWRVARAALDVEAAEDWTLSASELEAAEASRSARIRALEERLDAALGELALVAPRRQLAPVTAGELLLAWHPTDTGWVGFAATAGGVRSVPVSVPAPDGEVDAWAQALLVPFAEEIAAAEVIRLLPYGPVRSVDVHALPFGPAGEPLIATAPTSYLADLGPTAARPPTRAALVVVDPSGDLPAARLEGGAVAAALAAAEWHVARLDGDAADGPSLRAGLAGVGLLHYAGHGRFDGRGGYDSHLPLARGSELSLSDILTLAAPPGVVLSGCETGRSAAAAPVLGLGLAHAFLVAGADYVIAAVRPVEDMLSARLMGALYAAPEASPEARLRAAQRQIARDLPGSDWAAYRIFTR